MPHFYVDPKNVRDSRFTIKGDECHHLQHVLRKKVGDAVLLFDGRNTSYRGVITGIRPDEITGEVVKSSAGDDEKIRIHLFQALPKGGKFDFIVEKSTELGVSSITPVVSERCIKKIDAGDARAKKERWKKIACAASEQCGRTSIPVIHEPAGFRDVVKRSYPGTLQIIPWEGEEQHLLKDILRRLPGAEDNTLPGVNIWIGPEGGFSPKEITEARMHNIQTVTLGKRILRTETAAVVALALIQYELDML